MECTEWLNETKTIVFLIFGIYVYHQLEYL